MPLLKTLIYWLTIISEILYSEEKLKTRKRINERTSRCPLLILLPTMWVIKSFLLFISFEDRKEIIKAFQVHSSSIGKQSANRYGL
jgi:hypothetical protein